jgi:hypothetical protein
MKVAAAMAEMPAAAATAIRMRIRFTPIAVSTDSASNYDRRSRSGKGASRMHPASPDGSTALVRVALK